MTVKHPEVHNQQPQPSGMSFNLVPLKDLARGIDLRSAESNVQDGYCEDLVNVDCVSNGQILKRKGYEGYAGYVPLRVSQLTKDGAHYYFKLTDGIDLTGVASSPIVVYGVGQFLSSTYPGTAQAYSGFSVDVRESFNASGVTSVTKVAADTGVTSPYQLVFTSHSTSDTDASNSMVIPNSVSVNQTTYATTVGMSPVSTEREYLLIQDKQTVSGSSYAASQSLTASGGVCSATIAAATHGLGNFNIIPQLYYDDGAGHWLQFIPDLLTVDASTGDVAFSFTSASVTVLAVLDSAPTLDVQQITVGAGATVVTTIAGPFATNFPYSALYRLNGSTYDLTMPDDVTFDAVADTLSVTITNATASPETYNFYYDFATIAANTIKVVALATTSGTSTATDATPMLSIWGINRSGRYPNNGGGVNHIDTYKRQEEARVLCAASGIVFADRTRDEVGTTYLMPQLQMNLNARVASSASLGPLFATTGATTLRTRGLVTADNVAGGYAAVTDASFVSTGVCDYTLSLTNKSATLTIGTQLATTDYLTVTGMARAVHNGTFQVQSITSQTASQVVIRVANAELNFADFDETGASGKANVFTDRFTITAAANFLPGDVLSTARTNTVLSTSGTTVTISGVTSQVSLATGTLLFGTRTSHVQPLKSTANVASVANLVRGDIVGVEGLDRSPRVTYINPFHDMAASITVSGGVATVSIGSAVTATNVAGTWTAVAHGFIDNDPVMLETTGTLPAGLLSDMVYYVAYGTADTFSLKGQDGGVTTYTDTGGTGTITVRRVHKLSAGQRVAISQSGDPLLDGVFVVTSVPSLTSFTYATTTTSTSATGIMVGRTAEFDESLSMSDALTLPTTVTVTRRWIPAEAPTVSGGYRNANNTDIGTYDRRYPSYFNDTSTYMRSCMIGGNSYFINGSDDVMKFDGSTIYKAGLARWQPQAFCYLDTTVGSLTLDGVTTTVTAVSGNKFTVGTGDATQFAIGDRIVHSQNGAVYTVQSLDNTNKLVYTTATITGSGSGTLQKVKTYRYYARLNAIDANNNVVASAVTGSQDMVVELSAAGQIKWRFISMPTFAAYDYDRIELQLYRTIADTVTPYYLIRSVPLSYNRSDGYTYMDVFDATTDDVLKLRGSVGDDATMIALKGAQLGTGWDQPPRAKYLCAVQNKMVLGNIKDHQQLDTVFRPYVGTATLSSPFLNGTKLLLKKDSTDTGTTTDMLNRCTYEGKTSGAVTITPATDIACFDSLFQVTSVAHGLASGDWVYLFHSTSGADKSHMCAGWFQVVRSSADVFSVYTSVPSTYSASAADVDRYVAATVHTNVPVWLGADGNYSGFKSTPTDVQRFAMAINASMALTIGYHNAGYFGHNLGFKAWVSAHAGSEYAENQLILRAPASTAAFLQGEWVTSSGVFEIYVNNVLNYSSGGVAHTPVSASSLLGPSRVLVSYQNYPEIFDAPFAIDSDSIVDVNSADGEEITGVLPFFAESAFTSSQVASLVVVAKNTSLYILDLGTKDLQKIDSMGQGCTAPGSLAQTRNGIMFANASGIYRLNRNLTVSYVGKYIERYWKDHINAAELTNATATNFAPGRQYKLSVPVGSDSTNSVVLAYDYTRETPAYANADEGFGAWTRYTNHAATGWANLYGDAFFATSDGQVFRLRNTGDETDYRDDAAAVDEMVILVKSIDGGIPGVRKHCRAVITHMRMETGVTGTVMYSAVENSSTFQTIGTIVKSLDDKKVVSFRSSLPTHRFVYLSLKYTNAVKDEAFVLAGVDFLMAVLGTQGVVERSELS